jgi:hypothetical protein
MLEADASGLIGTIVADPGAIAGLFVLEPLDEAVSAFSLLAALLDRVREDRPEAEAEIAQDLADAIVKAQVDETQETITRRITLLSTLYNLRSDGREKCALLAQMVGLAPPSMLVEGQALGNLIFQDKPSTALVPSEPQLVSMLDSWSVPIVDRRDLYRAIADAIPDSTARKQRFTLLLVDSYKDPVSLHDGQRIYSMVQPIESVYISLFFCSYICCRDKWTNRG